MLRSGREITGGLGGGENIELAAEWTTRRWRGGGVLNEEDPAAHISGILFHYPRLCSFDQV